MRSGYIFPVPTVANLVVRDFDMGHTELIAGKDNICISSYPMRGAVSYPPSPPLSRKHQIRRSGMIGMRGQLSLTMACVVMSTSPCRLTTHRHNNLSNLHRNVPPRRYIRSRQSCQLIHRTQACHYYDNDFSLRGRGTKTALTRSSPFEPGHFMPAQ